MTVTELIVGTVAVIAVSLGLLDSAAAGSARR